MAGIYFRFLCCRRTRRLTPFQPSARAPVVSNSYTHTFQVGPNEVGDFSEDFQIPPFVPRHVSDMAAPRWSFALFTVLPPNLDNEGMDHLLQQIIPCTPDIVIRRQMRASVNR